LGTVAPAGDGKSFTYTPPPNFVGQDRFLYTVGFDPDDPPPAGSDMTAQVTVNVTETNDAPTAVDDSLNATEDTPLVFSANDLVGNDLKGPASESGQALTVTQVTPGVSTHGTLALNSGQLTYTPESNYNGLASFEYRVCDSGTPSLCDTGAVSLSVAAVNDLPVISALADQTTPEDTAKGPLAFTISDVETAAGSLLLSGVSSDPAVLPDANIVFGGSGGSRTVTVTPAANRFSSAGVAITLTVADGAGEGSGKTSTSFKLVINPVDDAPVVTHPGDQHVGIGDPLAVQILADDPDLAAGDENFEYSLIVTPTGLDLDIGSKGLITGTVTSSGPYTVEVFVRSGSLIGTTKFVISTEQYLVYLPNLIDRMSFGP
jgi:hypothetical protein